MEIRWVEKSERVERKSCGCLPISAKSNNKFLFLYTVLLNLPDWARTDCRAEKEYKKDKRSLSGHKILCACSQLISLFCDSTEFLQPIHLFLYAIVIFIVLTVFANVFKTRIQYTVVFTAIVPFRLRSALHYWKGKIHSIHLFCFLSIFHITIINLTQK